jgi:hypothetical protein
LQEVFSRKSAAETAGFFKQAAIARALKKDPALNALRQSPDFQKLLRRVGGGKDAP